MSQACRQNGFTLVEVLIALTLFSLIMVALVGGMRTLATSADAIDQRTQAMDDMRVVQHFLARAFELHWPARLGHGEDVRVAFVGGHDRISWSGALPARHAPHGLFWLQLAVEEGRDGTPQLVLCYAPLPAERDVVSLPRDCDRHVLQSGVEAFDLAYRDRGNGIWLDSWGETLRLPDALRVRIRSDGRWWPEQVLRPNHFSE